MNLRFQTLIFRGMASKRNDSGRVKTTNQLTNGNINKPANQPTKQPTKQPIKQTNKQTTTIGGPNSCTHTILPILLPFCFLSRWNLHTLLGSTCFQKLGGLEVINRPWGTRPCWRNLSDGFRHSFPFGWLRGGRKWREKCWKAESTIFQPGTNHWFKSCRCKFMQNRRFM